MLINFNTARLDKLLYDFYYLTGLSVGIFDSEYNKICFQPKETATFCRMINSTPEGKRRCDKSSSFGRPSLVARIASSLRYRL
jgi:ligand-binding sensor protein